MSREKILLVEDEPSISDAVVYALETDGYEVIVSRNGESAREEFEQKKIDLVLLDIGLPDVTGWELGKAFVAREVPVVFLTSRNSEIDRVAGLELGGDDYIVKPFSPRELVARVRAVLRRNNRHFAQSESVCDSRLTLDKETCRAFVKGKDLKLTRNEFRLLEVLSSRPGRVYSRDELLSLAWEDPDASQDRTVDAHIKQLRAKIRELDPDLDPIETRRGFGYAMRDPQ